MSDVNYQLSRFGSKMQTIGILAILSCVFGFLGFAWWGFFLVSLVMQFVILILIFSGLGNAREANLILNDNNLGKVLFL